VYVDVPYNYNYEYQGESCGPEVLSREFGVEFEFICNAAQSRFNLSKLGQVGNKELTSNLKMLIIQAQQTIDEHKLGQGCEETKFAHTASKMIQLRIT
jgi:hypothetical protein